MFKSASVVRNVRSYAITTFGLIVTAIGWTGFLIPQQITGGGVSGIGSLVYFATGFPVGLTYLIINAFLLVLAIRVLGASFGIRTIYGVVGLSFFLSLFQGLIHQPIVTDPFMATVIGGMLSGVGVGITFTQGGSTGGTDIIAMIVTKYRNTSPGRVIMYCDIVIISSSYILFHSLEKMVFGYVMMAVGSYVIDLVLTGSQQSYQITIFTRNHEAIAQRIATEVRRGVTVLTAQGWYTKQDVTVLLILCRKDESTSIFRIVKETDPAAFLSFSSVMGVYGSGFDRLKV
jgi:uncharacterized membrane-anchored protein YitT (DUF2179 family)